MTANTKKIIFLIVAVACLTYANALFHDFVGDDYVLFVNNTFYSTLKNIPKIFSSDFIMQFTDVDTASTVGKNSFSGFVSYRPATALTFFSDAWLWKDNPAGYHLTNIILHALVSILIFIFAGLITRSENLALMTALLFATHPINAEAVNTIGYRSDLLAALFYLLTFIAFIRQYNSKATHRNLWSGLCYASYFFSLFSKESAVTLLPMLIVYDMCLLSRGNWREGLYQKRVQYAGLLSILIFYLYVYWVIFPNSNSSGFFMTHFDVMPHLKLVGVIFYKYLTVLVFPFTVTVLPPVYAPSLASIKISELLVAALAVVAFLFVAVKSFKRNEREVTFFILWFLITYLPTSNILLLPNPYSFRFMYLPAIGFCALLTVTINRSGKFFNQWADSLDYQKVIRIALLSLYLLITIPLNMFYRNNYVNCKAMIRNYPDSTKPYLNLGMIYLQYEYYDKAIESFEKYLKNDPNNPFVTIMAQDYFVYHLLGRCYVNDLDKAISYFQKSISLRPDYVIPYLDLAQAYLAKKDYSRSIEYAFQAVTINRNMTLAYAFAIYGYAKLGMSEKAKDLLQKALINFPQDPDLRDLEKHIDSLK